MKRNRWLKLIITIVCFFIMKNVDAATCSTTELNTLKQLATNIKFNYELYDENSFNNIYYFQVSVINFTDQFYMIDDNGNEYQYVSSSVQNGERNLNTIKENSKLKFTIYASDKTNCMGTQILSKELSIPYFNPYSLREECLGIEDFSLCQRYYNGYIESEEYFIEQVNLYKSKNEIQVEKDQSILEIIFSFLKNHVWFIIPIVIVIVIVILIAIVRMIHNKKKIKIKI